MVETGIPQPSVQDNPPRDGIARRRVIALLVFGPVRQSNTTKGSVVGLEEVWRIREAEIYSALFGGEQRGIFPLSPELFAGKFGVKEIDPRWPFYGVFEHGPTKQRPFWLYATSGYSNPWDQDDDAYDPSAQSGAGIEFILATTERGDWAIRCLQNLLAYDLVLSAGYFEGREPLEEGDRIPLGSPIDGKENCLIRGVILSRASSLPADFNLPSGQVGFLTFTGVTDRERDFAKENGTDALIARLQPLGFFPVTDPHRASII
ncbi:MAG: suppressor of fused domain protein [Mesorhizobium sp.]|nr:MAG: suppressor of fused domain protein [Mesorhizobium sp.]